MKRSRKRTTTVVITIMCAVLAVPGSIWLSGGCTDTGALGLQDYQRDLLGLAVSLLLGIQNNNSSNGGNGNGNGDGDGAGQPIPGTDNFDLFVSEFFTTGNNTGGSVPVVAVPIAGPTLGGGGSDVVGYVTGIPQLYDDGNTIVMRISLYRTGRFAGGCLVFALDIRRLTTGSDIEAYGDTLYVRVDGPMITENDPAGAFITLDLPLNVPGGLDLPNDLTAGEFLAFELSTERSDGGTYQIIGVEFFESEDSEPISGATVFDTQEAVECEGGGFPDCNNNGIPDDEDVAGGTNFDCNENGIPDECDVAEGISFDCDNNGIPDECASCPPLDLVFVMDTSGSMNDEAAALCQNIEEIQAGLRIRGIEVFATVLGITEDPVHNPFIANPGPGADDGVPPEFSCLTDNVRRFLGAAVPNTSDMIDDSEDWGPSVAVVADRFPWAEGATRVIVPISDEDPQNGDTCDDPGPDRSAIEAAIAASTLNGVFVSPIVAEIVDGTAQQIECLDKLAGDLAKATGGSVFHSTDPDADLAGGISDIVVEVCSLFSDCNGNEVPDTCDVVDGVSLDGNNNGVPDECE